MNVNWELIVSSAITILGFIVTYFMTKKSLKDEIQKSKVSISLEKMEDIPFQLTTLFDKMSNNKFSIEDYSNLLSSIYSYCSLKAIMIAAVMQRTFYENEKKGENISREEKLMPLALITLLITQIKYDLTGEIVNPELWFMMKIKDYDESELKEIIHKSLVYYVDSLQLNEAYIYT